MIEFKQIIGRGTRLYVGKYYFTIYDFVKAYENFQDPAWDGEPVCPVCGNNPCTCEEGDSDGEAEGGGDACEPNPDYNKKPRKDDDKEEVEKPERLEIRLSDGRTRRIRFIKSDMFWGADGKPVSAEEFLRAMFGQMPEFYTSLEDLREKWSSPKTREELLDRMSEAGYDKETLSRVRTLIDADNSDLLDVLEYISFNVEPILREERAKRTDSYISTLSAQQQDFVNYVIDLYIREGIDELGTSKLPELLNMKYGSVQDGISFLGGLDIAKNTFYGFQRRLYLS